MTDPRPTLEQRVDALEAQQALWSGLHERVMLEAQLRAAGDMDLAALGVTMRSVQRLVQALGITQAEHSHSLAQVLRGQGQIVGMLNELIRREPGAADRPGPT